MKNLAAICLPVATVAVAFLLTAGFRAAADTITWTNTASGGWNTAANWSPNSVPGTNDTAIITNSGVTVSLNGKPIGPLGDKGVVRTLQLTSGGFKILPPDVPKPAPPTDLPTASPKPL